MNAKLLIEGLKLTASIGAYAWEQQIEQVILVDIELIIDITVAAEQDDLTKALDYASLVQLLQTSIKQQHFNLLETLAAFLQQQIITHYPQIGSGKLMIHKPGALASAKDVAIEICWS